MMLRWMLRKIRLTYHHHSGSYQFHTCTENRSSHHYPQQLAIIHGSLRVPSVSNKVSITSRNVPTNFHTGWRKDYFIIYSRQRCDSYSLTYSVKYWTQPQHVRIWLKLKYNWLHGVCFIMLNKAQTTKTRRPTIKIINIFAECCKTSLLPIKTLKKRNKVTCTATDNALWCSDSYPMPASIVKLLKNPF